MKNIKGKRTQPEEKLNKELKNNNEYVFTSKGEAIKLAEKMTKHEREVRAGKFKAFATDEFRIFDMETSIKPKINEGKTIRTRPLTAMEQGFRKLRQMTLIKKISKRRT